MLSGETPLPLLGTYSRFGFYKGGVRGVSQEGTPRFHTPRNACRQQANPRLSGLGHKCGDVSLPQGNSQAQDILFTALKAPESHPKATHKPTTSALLAPYYGILKLRYRSDALAPGLQHAWRALGRRLDVA